MFKRLNGNEMHGLIHPCMTLDDQTQVDSKPAGQPEHASLNQCQLIAANYPVIRPPAGSVIDARALIGPCSHVPSC